MPRVPALGHPTLWRAAFALREEGRSWAEIAARLGAETGRPMGARTVYALVEYARKRTGRQTLVLALSGPRAARAAAAARARRCSAPALVGRALALLLDDPALLDAVLDDGVATPREAGA